MALLGQFLNLLKTLYIVRNARFHSGRHARRFVDAPEVKLRHRQSMADDRLCALAYRRGPVLAGTLPRMEYDPKTYITETIRRAGGLASDLSAAAAMQESRAGARFQTVALQPRHQLTRQVPVIVGWALFIAMVVLVLAAVFVIS